MSRRKVYGYDGGEYQAYNKEQVRLRLALPHKKEREIKLIWCNYTRRKHGTKMPKGESKIK